MKQTGSLAALLLVGALALAAVWFFTRTDGAPDRNADALQDCGAAKACTAPLQLPLQNQPVITAPTPRHDPPPVVNDTVAPAAAPALDMADYGPAIARGGAFVDFELYDPAGNRVPVQYYSKKLWRKVGDFWLREEAYGDSDTHLIRCIGMGEAGIQCTGLEPGSYELELFSDSWGNFRHEFSVARGERRVDRLTTPNTRQAIAIRFLRQDNTPVTYLPGVPRLKAVSSPLPEVERAAASTVQLKRGPTEGPGFQGGQAWRSSRSGSGLEYDPPVPPLYATDNGTMWVYAFAGAENTISMKLNEGLYGRADWSVVDTFTSRSQVDVILSCCDDFERRVLEWGEPVEGLLPGNAHILGVPLIPERSEPFDPYTRPVRELNTRVILELDAPVPMIVQTSRDAKTSSNVFYDRGRVHFYDFRTGDEWWYRLTDRRLYVGPWEKLDLSAGGLVILKRQIADPLAKLDLSGLSPTLREFAHTLDFDIATVAPVPPAPTEDPRIVEDAHDVKEFPTDTPQGDLAPNPNDPPDHQRANASRSVVPADLTKLIKLVMVRRDGELGVQTIASGELVDGADMTRGLSTRVHIRGACRYNKESNSSARQGPDGRMYFEPKVLGGTWERADTGDKGLRSLLVDGDLKPRFDNVFVARAVGPQTEGLPWVRGVILRHEDDALAQQVREIAAGWKAHIPLALDQAEGYAARLAEAQAGPDDALLELMGVDAYSAFETREQRLWYATHGAWYDTRAKVYSDEQGYIAQEKPALEAGKCYVLYLWSNSRDDLRPDARFVFKVDEHGVADVGAIRLPTYTR